MNKPSERIVVFVTPAQKRAISTTADQLGISISELMRRAVIAFSATGDQVKAASIVDRLNAPREPDALAQILRKAAKPLRTGRAAGLRPALVEPAAADAQADADATAAGALTAAEAPLAPLPPSPTGNAESAAAMPTSGTEPDTDHAERTLAQAVARLSGEAAQATHVTEAEAGATHPEDAQRKDAEPLEPPGGAPFARALHDKGDEKEDAHRSDPTPDAGKFA